jgi:diaminopimelate epimerase
VLDSTHVDEHAYLKALEFAVHQHLPFVKMSGAGNDFIVFAADDLPDIDYGWLAKRICTRAMSVGADGLIIVTPHDDASARIQFFNPDGSVAEMCGNGSRCAARYVFDNRLVRKSEFKLLTDSGDLPVQRLEDGDFRVVMPPPRQIQLDYLMQEDESMSMTVDSVRVGVPHCVIPLEGLDDVPDSQLIRIGRALRYGEKFPDGVNVNFVEKQQDGAIRQRTYERGVENLTRACGTGATAIASVLMKRGVVDPPVELVVDGGRLTIAVENNEYWLSGDARMIYTGVMNPEAVEW